MLLNCLIKGEDIVFLITAVCEDVVIDLKFSIQRQRLESSLKGVDPNTLELWKVSAIDKLLCEMTLLFSAQGLQPHRRRARRHSC